MPLSEYEQRVLEQMERQLSSDDPKLVNTFQGGATRSVRRWLLTGAGALVGLAVLVLGVVLPNAVVGVLGFVLMFVSVVLAVSPPRRRASLGVVSDSGAVRRPAMKAPSGGFMQRLEARWDRRREQGR